MQFNDHLSSFISTINHSNGVNTIVYTNNGFSVHVPAGQSLAVASEVSADTLGATRKMYVY